MKNIAKKLVFVCVKYFRAGGSVGEKLVQGYIWQNNFTGNQGRSEERHRGASSEWKSDDYGDDDVFMILLYIKHRFTCTTRRLFVELARSPSSPPWEFSSFEFSVNIVAQSRQQLRSILSLSAHARTHSRSHARSTHAARR